MKENKPYSVLSNYASLRILLVEDNPGDIRLFQETMRELPDNLAIDYVTCLKDAFPKLDEKHFDVILLDLFLPDGNGLEVIGRIRAHAPDAPIVVLTGLNDEQTALNAMWEGVQDYLIKGTIDGRSLLRAIRYAIERSQMQMTIRALSLIDDLTGVYNRHGFMNLATYQIRLTRRRKSGFHLLLLHVDNLREINQSEGDTSGNRILIATARLCSDTMRSSDIVARVENDEFAIIMPEAEWDNIATVIERLDGAIARYNQQNSDSLLSFSYGVVCFQSSTSVSLEHLLMEARKIANSHELRLSGIQKEEVDSVEKNE
ncbi:MAG: diguanylate cyclase [Zoogloeaceae bacterium]|jgi:diguanylate cyclase (GGDEF)-like protein|nr:diguanylate cyclase [Zoogloeaceae bacterium]